MIILQTTMGDITIELDLKNTPLTSNNFLRHAKNGYYNNSIFHRVIDDFMIQGGGFGPNMQEKPRQANIENEADHGQPNNRGAVAMARTSDPHSASTQFFINVKDNTFLNFTAKRPEGWGYCVFGKVTAGMDVVDKIKQVETTQRAGHSDVPINDVVIEKVIVTEAIE